MGIDAMAGAASQQGAGRTTAWAIAACVQGKNANAQTNAQMRGNVRKDCMDLDRGKGAKTWWGYLSDAFRLVNRGRGLVFQMIAANNILLIVARENLRVNCKRAIQA
ncbi:MAG: hypothetical protein B7X46_14110 [Thiomonas sp. 15-66-11]|nr:MAG: hypothetical protein B7X46_14110 [Thiomonas sp. 15-66-11]